MPGRQWPWWRWPTGQTHPQTHARAPRHRGPQSRAAGSPAILWDGSGHTGLSRGQCSGRGRQPGSPLALSLAAPWAGRCESAPRGSSRRPWHRLFSVRASSVQTGLTWAPRSSGAWGLPDPPGSPRSPGDFPVARTDSGRGCSDVLGGPSVSHPRLQAFLYASRAGPCQNLISGRFVPMTLCLHPLSCWCRPRPFLPSSLPQGCCHHGRPSLQFRSRRLPLKPGRTWVRVHTRGGPGQGRGPSKRQGAR